MSEDPIGKVCVGAVAGAFGVRGDVRLKSFCAQPEAIGDYAPLTDAEGREYGVKITRQVKGGFAARLTGALCVEVIAQAHTAPRHASRHGPRRREQNHHLL